MRTISISIIILFFSISTSIAKNIKTDTLSILSVKEDPSDKELLLTLKNRRKMLNWHRYTAWTTIGLMGATLLTRPEGETDDTHKILGIASGVSYLAAASLAYFGHKPTDIKQTDNILIHKTLIWIHAPAMLLTAYAGIRAHNQHKKGEELDTIADMHSAFAAIAAISFGLAAVTSMDWSLRFIPTSKKGVACLFTKSF